MSRTALAWTAAAVAVAGLVAGFVAAGLCDAYIRGIEAGR